MGDPGSGGLIVLVVGSLGREVHAFPPEGLRYIRTMNQYRICKRVTGAAKIPIDPIHISPMCRVRDTAAAAFPGRDFMVDKQLMYTANLTVDQKVPILEHTRQLLSGPVAPGHNLLVIAHGPNLADLTGYFPKEATLVVFQPAAATGFRYVASIRPELWSKLVGKNVAR